MTQIKLPKIFLFFSPPISYNCELLVVDNIISIIFRHDTSILLELNDNILYSSDLHLLPKILILDVCIYYCKNYDIKYSVKKQCLFNNYSLPFNLTQNKNIFENMNTKLAIFCMWLKSYHCDTDIAPPLPTSLKWLLWFFCIYLWTHLSRGRWGGWLEGINR